MAPRLKMLTSLLLFLLVCSSLAEFLPCPLLGPRFPIPKDLVSSPVIQDALKNLTAAYQETIDAGNTTEFGPTTPNTTTFSVALFSADGMFYDFHHIAPEYKSHSTGTPSVDANSIYRIGGVTQVFTVWSFLIAAGERHWSDPITYWIPELAQAYKAHNGKKDPITHVQWGEITLGDLAAYLADIPRDYGSDVLGTSQMPCTAATCTRKQFFDDLLQRASVYLPATGPIYSNTAFQLVAYALESITKQTYEKILSNEILSPLQLKSTSLHNLSNASAGVVPINEKVSGWSKSYGQEASAKGMYSSVKDLSTAGAAILSSRLLPSAVTRRWLKPVSHTSNLVNSVGRPWIIYSATADQDPINPVVEVFISYSTIGHYASYIGLVPDYNVGYTILAADQNGAPDLNAYADIVAALVPALEANAYLSAKQNFGGSYTSNNDQVTIAVNDSLPGMAFTSLTVNGTDIKAKYAQLLDINPNAFSFRLYPTNLQTAADDNGHSRVAFRAVFQDEDALVDAGTPTCVSSQDVDTLTSGTRALDLVVFTVDEDGSAVSLEVPALNLTMARDNED